MSTWHWTGAKAPLAVQFRTGSLMMGIWRRAAFKSKLALSMLIMLSEVYDVLRIFRA